MSKSLRDLVLVDTTKCPDCDGGKFLRVACTVDGVSYPAVECACETCGGEGVLCEHCGYRLDDCNCGIQFSEVSG